MTVSPGTQRSIEVAFGSTAARNEIIRQIDVKYTLNADPGPVIATFGLLAGAGHVFVQCTGIRGSTLTTRPAYQMIEEHGFVPGQVYCVRLINGAASGSMTLVGGAGVTIGGKTVILFNTAVDYIVTITSPTTITIQSVGTLVWP